MNCERCGEATTATNVSYFNTQTICMKCTEIERKHPRFEEAREAENAAVRAGNLNFPGIGLPSGLARVYMRPVVSGGVDNVPRPGERYRLKVDVDRYPDFVARAGLTGTVIEAPDDTQPKRIALKMDEPLAGAEQWENSIEWYANPWTSALEEFRRDTEPLRRWIVRQNCEHSILVQADSEEAAMDLARTISKDQWDQEAWSALEAEEQEETHG